MYHLVEGIERECVYVSVSVCAGVGSLPGLFVSLSHEQTVPSQHQLGDGITTK